MKKYSYYIDESTIQQVKGLLAKYEKESDFVRTAIQNEIDKRKKEAPSK